MQEVKIKFTADTANAVGGINKVKGSLNQLGSGAQGLMGKLGAIGIGPGALGAGALVGAFTAAVKIMADGVKRIIDMVGALQDMADMMNSDVGWVKILEESLVVAGGEAEQLKGIMVKLANVMENPSPEILETIDKLGLSFEALKGMDLQDQFSEIGTAINKLGTQQEKIAAFSKLMGKGSAKDLVVMFGDADNILKTSVSRLGRMPDMLDAIAKQATEVGDAWDGITTKWDQYLTGFTASFLPAMEKVSTLIKDWDLSSLGLGVGSVIQTQLDFLTDNPIKRMFKMFNTGLNLIGLSFQDIVNGFGFGLYKVVSTAYDMIMEMADSIKGMFGGGETYTAPKRMTFEEYKKEYGLEHGSGYGEDAINRYNQAQAKIDAEIAERVKREQEKNRGSAAKAPPNSFLTAADNWLKSKLQPIKDAGGLTAVIEDKLLKAGTEARIKKMRENQMTFPWGDGDIGEALGGKRVEEGYKNPRYEPILSSLGRIGGSKAEIGTAVETFQKESLKYQMRTAYSTERMANNQGWR